MAARVDQLTSTVRDLVESVRQHRATGCDVPVVCPGDRVVAYVDRLSDDTVAALLMIALGMLADRADVVDRLDEIITDVRVDPSDAVIE